nr:hypothetical protein CFP56_70646 [Quercus suber]
MLWPSLAWLSITISTVGKYIRFDCAGQTSSARLPAHSASELSLCSNLSKEMLHRSTRRLRLISWAKERLAIYKECNVRTSPRWNEALQPRDLDLSGNGYVEHVTDVSLNTMGWHLRKPCASRAFDTMDSYLVSLAIYSPAHFPACSGKGLMLGVILTFTKSGDYIPSFRRHRSRRVFCRNHDENAFLRLATPSANLHVYRSQLGYLRLRALDSTASSTSENGRGCPLIIGDDLGPTAQLPNPQPPTISPMPYRNRFCFTKNSSPNLRIP